MKWWIVPFVVLLCTAKVYGQKTQTSEIIHRKAFLGVGFSLVNNYAMGNVLDFWQRVNNDPGEHIEQAAGYYMIRAGFMQLVGDKSWLGADFQLGLTPSHALWGTNLFFGGRNEVYFRVTQLNIAVLFSTGVDDQGKVQWVFEPGLDLGWMSGVINVNNDYYEEAFAIGIGGHGATGLDLLMGEHLLLNFRAGYRFLRIDEIHADSNSQSGYSSFYVNGVDGETVQVDWSGLYLTVGLALSLNKSAD